MPCSRSLASQAKMIWIRLISVMDHPRCCRQRSIVRPGPWTTNLGSRRERLVMDMSAAAARARSRSPSILSNRPRCARKLLTELGNITSADLAAAWAREALTAKNSLTATDAKLVEDAFERKLLKLPWSET